MTLWLSFFHPISAYFRRRRFANILRKAPSLLSQRVLDVGGSVHFWDILGIDPKSFDLTILNIALDGQSTDIRGTIRNDVIVLYDGLTIPWPDRFFDWAISNSVIEHVPPLKRAQFSLEIQRVAKNYWIQTPAYVFPVEPHFVLPILHWLPRHFGRRIAGWGLWGLLRRRTRPEIDRYFDEVVLLTLKEFQSLFPWADVITERFLGIPKSYTLMG
jgi:hypothetical protein